MVPQNLPRGQQKGEKCEKQTDKPSLFMMSTKFTELLVMKLVSNRRYERKLTGVQRVYLQALQITPECLLDPGGV